MGINSMRLSTGSIFNRLPDSASARPSGSVSNRPLGSAFSRPSGTASSRPESSRRLTAGNNSNKHSNPIIIDSDDEEVLKKVAWSSDDNEPVATSTLFGRGIQHARVEKSWLVDWQTFQRLNLNSQSWLRSPLLIYTTYSILWKTESNRARDEKGNLSQKHQRLFSLTFNYYFPQKTRKELQFPTGKT